MIRFLIIGDVVGKAGRKCLTVLLPRLREEFNPAAVIINGENLAGGFGITAKIYQQCVDLFGIDVLTMGNHWQDKKDIHPIIDGGHHRMVLPANMHTVHEEQGLRLFQTRDGTRFAVMNFIGKAFMNPDHRGIFDTIERLKARVPDDVRIRLVDMHAEATSEKQGVGRFLDGWASVVWGTHCHVPTADERILTNGTGFVTDIGMTGAYDSVIGIEIGAALKRLRNGEKRDFEPATGDPWLCAVVADIDPATGRCLSFQRLRREMSQYRV